LKEVVAVGRMNVNLLWASSVSLFTGTLAGLARGLIYAGWAVVLASGILLSLQHFLKAREKFWLLVLGLAVAPSAGLMLLDFLWKKHLHIDRYLACAGPFLAVIAGYGLAKVLSCRPKLGWCLAAGVLLVQLSGINWGQEIDVHMGSRLRSLAKTIQATPASSRLVVIVGDQWRLHPAAPLIYELGPDVVIVTLGTLDDLDRLYGLIAKYECIWFVPCPDDTIEPIEREFLSRLSRSDGYRQVSFYPPDGGRLAVLLRRTDRGK